MKYCPLVQQEIKRCVDCNLCDEETCETCNWYDAFSGVCCNGDSEHRADFMNKDYSCRWWEKKKVAIDERTRTDERG